jgi:hypothetical protein
MMVLTGAVPDCFTHMPGSVVGKELVLTSFRYSTGTDAPGAAKPPERRGISETENDAVEGVEVLAGVVVAVTGAGSGLTIVVVFVAGGVGEVALPCATPTLPSTTAVTVQVACCDPESKWYAYAVVCAGTTTCCPVKPMGVFCPV